MEAFVLILACAVVPVAFAALFTDAARRGRLRFPRPILRAAHVLWNAFVFAPIAFVVLFELLLLRVWIATGSGPQEGHFDPHAFTWVDVSPRAEWMPLHAWTVFAAFVMAHAAILAFVFLWPAVRTAHGADIRRALRIWAPAYVLVWAVMLSQSYALDQWFMASLLDG